MPILGKSARACFDAPVDHLNPLVHKKLVESEEMFFSEFNAH